MKFNDVGLMVTCIGRQYSCCRGAGRAKTNLGKTQFDLRRYRCATFFLSLMAAIVAAMPLKSRSAETNTSATVTNTPKPQLATTNGLGVFQLKRGFHVELVASEPMVTAPVAMAFDENGRLFVVEMHGRDTRGMSVGRVRMLDKMNDDGVFQNSTIYAENLALPSAVACYAGGVFVAAGPEIIYLKDTKADGLADARQVVMSGFGATNADLLPNNFNWGPDNRIHASSGGVGGEISGQNAAGPPVSINRYDFSFDPRTLEVFPEAGPSESGLSFDSRGREYVSDFNRPLLTPAYEARYALRNPYYPKPPALAVVCDPFAPIYPYLPPATNRQASVSIAARRMARARGCVVYRGRAFPTDYFDNVFIADQDEHLIHRVALQENGLSVLAQRPPDEPNTEFLVCRDPSFRPVQLINGPDGAIYIADIQDGAERGRIYRVLPDHLKRAKPPQLGKVKTYELVSILAQGDGWHRDTAARLLYERRDPAAPALLRGTLSRSRLTQARVLALHALAGAGALSEEDLMQGLRDPDAAVRCQALLLSETRFKNADVSSALLSQLGSMGNDSSPAVRYQLAFTLGELQRADAAPVLAQLVVRDAYEPWVQNAGLDSALSAAGPLFTSLAGNASFNSDPSGFEFLRQLATMIGVSGHQDAVSQAATFIARGTLSSPQAYELLYDLGDGLYRTRSSLALVDTQGALQTFYSSALNLAADPTQSEAARIAATRLLGVSTLSVGSIADWILLVCSPPTSPALQSAAVDVLSRYTDPQVVNGFLRMWPVLTPVARARAVSALLSRDVHVAKILDALQSGNLRPADLSSSQRNFLRTHPVPEIRERALQLLGPVPLSRPAETARYKPALSLRGDIARGREVFRQRCAECHVSTVTNQVTSFGPGLLRARSYSKDLLLSRIVEPNLNVRPDYTTQVVESKEGQRLLGIVADENTASLTLKQIDRGILIWPQLNIRAVQSQSWSLMPEGLEVGLAVQDMADLLEYLVNGR